MQQEIASGDTEGLTHFARVNLERAVPLIAAASKDAQLIVSAGRFDEARTLTLRGCKTPRGTHQQIELVGLKSLMEGDSSASLDVSELSHVPSDAALAVGTVVDMDQWYQSTIELMSRVSQREGQQFQRDIERMSQELFGLPIDKALGALGDQLTVAVSSDGDLVSAVIYTLSIKDREVVTKINEDPQTPAQWYSNALIHSQSGNAVEARRAYLQFFQSNVKAVDPYQSFASLLRLQEDRNGAVRGPFEIPFDLRQVRQQRAVEWLTGFEKENLLSVSTKLISFGGILIQGYDAIQEIRYGVNQDQPDRTFPIPQEILQRELTKDETRIWPGSAIQFVVVQFVYKNGESSELYRCEP